jgi:hypothetical protein
VIQITKKLFVWDRGGGLSMRASLPY